VPIEPPDTDADNAPARSATKASAKRTLLLWGVLILVFASIYSMSSPSDPDRPGSPSNWARVDLVSQVPVAVMVAVVGFLLWSLRRAGLISRQLAPGRRAVAQRRFDDAERVLAAVAAKAGPSPWAAPLAHYNLALARVLRGDLAGAETSLATVERWAGLAYGSNLRVLAAIDLARVHALQGHVDLARRWLGVAQRRFPKDIFGEEGWTALPLAEALVLLREGKPREAIALFEQHAAELETTVPYDTMRQWWALVAFARWQDAGPRDQGAIDVLLRRLHPMPPHALAPLVVAWPELRGFLETHGVPAEALARD
jgi:predicted negative regulator of RcsB-dependent stress response